MEDRLLQVILGHEAMMMLMVGCQGQTMLSVGDIYFFRTEIDCG